jgi:hypothetical protein
MWKKSDRTGAETVGKTCALLGRGQDRRLVMYSDEQRQSFLAKAIEAEKEAQTVQDASLKESWLTIAQTYRALAGVKETESQS